MLPALIAQIGIPAILELIGKGLDKVDNPRCQTGLERD